MDIIRNSVVLLVALIAAWMCVPYLAEAESASHLASVVDEDVSSYDWGYGDGPYGPANWKGACSEGTKQSPINVNLDWIHLDGTLDVPSKIFYEPAPAFVYGDGKILEVRWAGGIYNCHNLDYHLEKLVFHTPSEHTYANKSFPLEIQFYHTTPDGLPWETTAINSLVFEEGAHNDWLEQIIPSLPTKETLGEIVYIETLDSAGVEGDDLDWTRYYRYLGSETTPPCTENPSVVWSLLKAPLSASKKQIEKIEATLLNKSNARPIPEMAPRYIFYPRYVDDMN